jgi:RsiW-degrading membrane proteinase PrsW (M82 family)
MDAVLLLILALAPAIFWLYYFYSRDRYDPEPLAWILAVYLLGIAVTLPVALIEGVAGMITTGILTTIVIAPVVEESAKYLVVKKSVYPSIEFDEPVDGIVYAAAAGLGFATLENVIYVFSSFEGSFFFAVQTGVVRALLSVPGHVLFSAMWGYALGQSRFLPPARGRVLVFSGLVLAIGAHGFFNFLLFSDLGFAFLVLILVPLLWVVVDRRIRRALEQSVFRFRE